MVTYQQRTEPKGESRPPTTDTRGEAGGLKSPDTASEQPGKPSLFEVKSGPLKVIGLSAAADPSSKGYVGPCVFRLDPDRPDVLYATWNIKDAAKPLDEVEFRRSKLNAVAVPPAGVATATTGKRSEVHPPTPSP